MSAKIDFHGGASYPGRRANRLTPCSAEVKLLRPICKTCEDIAGGMRYLEPLWFEKCPHDPYVSIREVKTTLPVYEDVCRKCDKGPHDETEHIFTPTGNKRITGQDTKAEFVPVPNWQSSTRGGGVNKGDGIRRSLWKGFIYPQQLKSPFWPNGIKMRCMFRDCLSEDVKEYKNGWFCREVEAQLVAMSDTSTTYEVGQFSKRSDQIQAKQLASMAV